MGVHGLIPGSAEAIDLSHLIGLSNIMMLSVIDIGHPKEHVFLLFS
jgi:hypothetical protein